VQRTIDRVIFLRICEDRGIEPYGRLQDLLNGTAVYRRLAELFQRADERYNSGLFYFTEEKGRQDPPDELTLGLAIDDKPLKEIIRKLYYPDSPYEFAVLPAEILGQVYEQFLGRVIRLTRGHRAVVEEKPEVKKAGGVYYTPAYIVDYIVEHTVGKLLQEDRGQRTEGSGGREEGSGQKAEGSGGGKAEALVAAGGKGEALVAAGGKAEALVAAGGKAEALVAAGGSPRGVRSRETAEEATTERPPRWITPRRAAKLRIVDPACGSGSFLIGAYQYLLDWHRDRYVESGPEKHARGRNPKLYRGPAGDWRLTTAERKRILLNNIYGVDIDPQAVEVTKLSLLLKVLEGESGESLETQRRLFHERALPDLAANIKCGNSLIGPDFYADKQMSLLDDEEVYRINAFDWKAEFPEVFKRKNPGFDAVIGNPPWGQKGVDFGSGIKEYLRGRYESLDGIMDMFRPFVEKGVTLAAKDGMFGMVLPDIVLLKDYPATRLFILDHLAIDEIQWWGMAFRAAVIDAATILGKHAPASTDHLVRARVNDPEAPLDHAIAQADFRRNPRCTFNLHLTPEKRAVLDALRGAPRLGDYFEVHEGVHSGNMRAELFVGSRVDDSCERLYFGRDEIAPYRLQWKGRYVRLGVVPTNRGGKKYANVGQPGWHRRCKVLVRRTGDHVMAAVDRHGYYASNNFFLVFPKQKSSLDLDGLSALLNSPFMTWYFRAIEPRKGRVFAELKIKHLTVFPLPGGAGESSVCTKLNSLGKQRSEVAERLHRARTPHERDTAARVAGQLDQSIDSHILSSLGLPADLQSAVLQSLKGG